MSRITKTLSILQGSDFRRNAITVARGTFIAQLISIIAVPVLTRIYTPADYGLLGIYVSITGLVAIGATLTYSHGIILSKSDDDAAVVANLCVFITTGISLLCFLFILLSAEWIVEFFHAPLVKPWLFLAPLTIFSVGITEIYTVYINRLKKYRYLNISRVGSILMQIAISISVGLIYNSALGLFLGILLSQFIAAIFLIFVTHKMNHKPFFKVYPANEYKDKAIGFKNFPMYSLPSSIINNFCYQIPVFMIGAFLPNSFTTIGAFNMSIRLLGLPTQLLSNSIAEVFRQRASEDYNTTGNCRPIFLKTLRFLFYFSIVPFLLIAIFSPQVFSFFLGKNWELSGRLTQALTFMYFMRFIISPLAYTIYIARKQYISLIMDIYMTIASYSIFYLCLNVYHVSIFWTVVIYAMNYGLMYLLTLHLAYKNTIKNYQNALAT